MFYSALHFKFLIADIIHAHVLKDLSSLLHINLIKKLYLFTLHPHKMLINVQSSGSCIIKHKKNVNIPLFILILIQSFLLQKN